MARIPPPAEGVTVDRDLRSDTWAIRVGASSVTLRRWTWGERRRLVEFASRGGALNRGLFIDGLFELLLEGSRDAGDRTVLAFTCLYLLEVPEGNDVVPLARAELIAVRTFGWTPQQLDAQLASDVDRLIAHVQPHAAGDDGWTHIVLVSDAATSVDARLERMLNTVAHWAGLTAEPPAAAAPSQDTTATPQPVPHEPKPAVETISAPFQPTFPGTAKLHVAEDIPRRKQPAVSADVAPVAPRVASRLPEPAASPPKAAAPPLDPPMRRIAATLFSQATAPAPRTWSTPDAAAHVHRATPPAPAPPIPETARPAAHGSALSEPAPQVRPIAPEMPLRKHNRPLFNQAPVPANSKPPEFPATDDFFPTFRFQVRWPEAAPQAAPAPWPQPHAPEAPPTPWPQPHAPRVPENPFAHSEIEEQIADVLDRAAREAGIDLP